MQVIAILYSKVYVFGFDILEWKKKHSIAWINIFCPVHKAF